MKIAQVKCDGCGLIVPGRTDETDADAPDDYDPDLPVGWGEVVIRAVVANPEWASIEARRIAMLEAVKANNPNVTEDQLPAIEAQIADAIPGTAEVYSETKIHLSPAELAKLARKYSIASLGGA